MNIILCYRFSYRSLSTHSYILLLSDKTKSVLPVTAAIGITYNIIIVNIIIIKS